MGAQKTWGISTVIMNKRGNPCPKCLPFCGKVLIDDVWSGGDKNGADSETKKKYPTMSYAISRGLYHPRCRDSHTTYFPGISTADDTWTKEELEDIGLQAKEETKQQYAKRQAEKFERLAKYSLDEENQKLYEAKAGQWRNASSENTLQEQENDVKINLKDEITDTSNQILKLKEQFGDLTDGYSYDEWFKDFNSIEEGYGEELDDDASLIKLKELDQRIKDATKKKTELLHQKEKRSQLDTGYSGRIPDDELDTFNAKAFEQIKSDTGYSDEKATEFQKALQEYFGGDYESILSGETPTAKIIRSGIERMPVYDGGISRGMIFDNTDVKTFTDLQIGDELPQKGLIESWSSEKGTAIAFSGISDYERSSVVLECADNKTAVGVQHLSLFGSVESEVLSCAKYEVVEVVTQNKYDYLSDHKEYLYFPEDLEDEKLSLKENVVCVIKVKEKN